MIDAKRSLRRYPVRSRSEDRVNGYQLIPIQQKTAKAVFWSGRCGFLARLLRLGSKRRDPNLRVALYIKRR